MEITSDKKALFAILLFMLALVLSGCVMANDITDVPGKAEFIPETEEYDDAEYEPENIIMLEYTESDRVLDNPYTGFAVWATSSKKKISNAYSLVYADVTWSEIEKKEGIYDFDSYEEKNQFSKWKAEGKHAIIRIVLDRPGKKNHMDIPKWLYEKTGDGTFYDVDYGKGYSPNYENETLIECHRKLIEAFGERYDNDPFVSYVELGSLGHWGEWHVHSEIGTMPKMPVCREYLLPYEEYFSNVKIMMRRPFTIGRKYNIGLYNDSACIEKATEEWLGWIENGGDYEKEKGGLASMPEEWKTAPIGGEISSRFDDLGVLLDESYDETLSLFRKSHTSWIGPYSFAKYTVKNDTEKENLDDLLKTIGYRLYVSEVSYDADEGLGTITCKLSNAGIAPFYFGWKIVATAVCENGTKETLTVDADIMKALPGEPLEFKVRSSLKNVSGWYIGIHDPNDPDSFLELAMDTEQTDGMYKVL